MQRVKSAHHANLVLLVYLALIPKAVFIVSALEDPEVVVRVIMLGLRYI